MTLQKHMNALYKRAEFVSLFLAEFTGKKQNCCNEGSKLPLLKSDFKIWFI